MAAIVSEILRKGELSKEDIIYLLGADGDDLRELFREAARIKQQYVGNSVYYRGLIEFSNICAKNCYYCGIRKGNREVKRYNITDDEIVAAAQFALDNNYGSIALQAGELESDSFTSRITGLLKRIKLISEGKLGITISLGEQTMEVYKEWFDAGAHRYLLRIESSDRELYKKIHPQDDLHSFDRRTECLRDLQKAGYQTGTGVMIGLPFQTLSNLAEDILFMRDMDIDMVGMGPYIEHENTPLIHYRDQLLPIAERFDMSLKMIAVLRIVMKDINIAAATALQAIDPMGREKAIRIGANIIMPNITPGMYRDSYSLYENKPCTDEAADDCRGCLEARLSMADADIGYGEWGDSKHWHARQQEDRDTAK
ncbi:MAG: [FeFe] hydrogenase H-cluster radical SAM maturase HydE [Bacteroidales bacterium]|nr:[FeFe] hydrogenase H-cluster radical SAM maturase HydE [Bacteroidales bacterium]